MGAIQIFHSEQFGDIRTAGNSEQPQFCLSDLCKTLDLQASAVTRRLSKDVISSHTLSTAGGNQLANFVNESGMFNATLLLKQWNSLKGMKKEIND